MINDDEVLKARVAGKSVRRIARDHGVSEDAIGAILDQRAGELMTEKSLRRALMLELQRLDDYVETFHPRALEGDPVCGALCVKISERRATLLGLNAPLGHAVQIIHRTEPEKQKTSTEHLRGILDNILHISHRERELLDRHELEGDNDPATIVEINELRAARGKSPLGDPSGPS